MSVERLSKFKKKGDSVSEELSAEERKKEYENYMSYVADCTDRVICQYLCKVNDYAINDVFGDLGDKTAGMSFKGTHGQYEIKFTIVNDESKYSLVRPVDVKEKVFTEVINHMDTLIRMDVLFKKRLGTYLQYQNTRKNAPKNEVVEGCKIFLRKDKPLYYVGNKFMSDEHIAFVQKMRTLPFSIGLVISKV